MCGFCEVQNSSENLLDIFSEEERDKFLRDIYSGVVSNTSLDINYYYKVARKLTEGIYNGFGQELIKTQWGTPDYDMLHNLRESAYIFSGAKNYQQTKEISSLLTTENGIKPFSEFEKDAAKVFDTYNKNYLTAEYNSAIAQGRSASIWMEIEREKSFYSQLQYETVGDGRVRPEHAELDNIIRPVDDKFWDVYYPPNGWNCRCIVIQTNDVINTDLSTRKPPTEKEVPEIFRFNVGKTKQIFSPKHPYFEVARAEREFAKQNFGLPLPEKTTPIIEPKIKENINEELDKKIKDLGVNLDKRVYDLLNKKVELVVVKDKGSSALGNVIKIDTGERWKKSVYQRYKVLYHELGHVIHNQQGIISSWRGVSEEYSKHFNQLKRLIKGKGELIDKKIREISYKTYKPEVVVEILDKYGLENVEDLKEALLSTADSLMALSNRRYGYGHTNSYMARKTAKEAEMFAHSMENFFDGNPVFKDLMPEVYEESIKYIESLLNK